MIRLPCILPLHVILKFVTDEMRGVSGWNFMRDTLTARTDEMRGVSVFTRYVVWVRYKKSNIDCLFHRRSHDYLGYTYCECIPASLDAGGGQSPYNKTERALLFVDCSGSRKRDEIVAECKGGWCWERSVVKLFYHEDLHTARVSDFLAGRSVKLYDRDIGSIDSVFSIPRKINVWQNPQHHILIPLTRC